MNKNQNYLKVKGEIPPEIPLNSFISIDRNPPPKIYSFGFQPAKSIPEIPRWFLNKYSSKNHKILDPFAGSGTTLMEVILFGAQSFWMDYHPLSQLICRVKTTRFDVEQLKREGSDILQNARKEEIAPSSISFNNKDFWFQKEVSEALEILRKEIDNADDSIKEFFWLVFSNTIRKASDMNDGMILAARRSNIKSIPKRSRSDVFKIFRMYNNKGIAAIEEWESLSMGRQSTSSMLPESDARNLDSKNNFDAIITSPPYINAIDYVWASKFELHWLGMVNSAKERLNLYSQEIGTERIPSKEYKELGQTNHEELDKFINDIYNGVEYRASKGQNELRARVVWKYFIDMKTHFESAYNVLKDGGKYCLAIGDTCKICGVKIPVASLLSDFAEECGFNEIFRFRLLLKNRKLNLPRNINWADIIKHDAVIVLEK